MMAGLLSSIRQPQKPKVLIVLIWVALILSTTACVGNIKTNVDEFNLNPDATIGAVTWGMAKEEVKESLPAKYVVSDYASFEPGDSLMLDNIGLLGERATAIYTFTGLQADNPQEELINITIIFHGEPVKNELISRISNELGDIETKGTTLNGSEYDLSEENYYWHSKESIYDVLSDQGKIAAFEALKESEKEVRDIDQDYANWWFSQRYLTTARLEDVPRFEGLCLVLSGEGYLLKRKLNNDDISGN